MGLREKLFAPQVKEVETPDTGKFYIRIIDGLQMQAYQKATKASQASEKEAAYIDAYACLVSIALCDSNGDRLFKDDEIEIVKGLARNRLTEIFEAAHAYNYPPAEEVKKNLDTTTPSTSS